MNGPASASTRARPAGTDRHLLESFLRVYDQLLQRLSELLRNHDDARDALQTTFLKCWQNRGRVGQIKNLPGWLWHIGLNAGRDLLRDRWRRSARPLPEASEVDPAALPPELLAEQEERQSVHAAVMNLRPEERQVFSLRREGGRTWEEIAALCRRPVGTVKTQMRAALHKLREMLVEGRPLRG